MTVSVLTVPAPPRSPAGDTLIALPADLHTIAGEVVRDMIRRDPALWACVQADPDLRRQFGFDDPPPPPAG